MVEMIRHKPTHQNAESLHIFRHSTRELLNS